MRNGLLLGIDIGAGSLRAGLVRVERRVVSSAAVPLGIVEPHRGWAEADPEAWWQAFVAATARALRAMPRGAHVIGMCVCGLTRTQVLLDRRGRPLGRAILFRDRRAAAIAQDMEGVTAFDRQRDSRGSSAISRAASPASTGWSSRRITSTFRLCGAHAPQGAAPWHAVGRVQALARPLQRIAGVPVFAGAMDTWASAVGGGAVQAGQAYDVAGTSEAVGLLTPAPATAAGLASLRVDHRCAPGRRTDASRRRLRALVPRPLPRCRAARRGDRARGSPRAGRPAAVPALSCGRTRTGVVE